MYGLGVGSFAPHICLTRSLDWGCVHRRDMRVVAEEVASNSGGRIILREIRWKTFNDGFPNLFIEVLCAVVLCYSMLCCAVLYCAVLCCAILCCAVLYCGLCMQRVPLSPSWC